MSGFMSGPGSASSSVKAPAKSQFDIPGSSGLSAGSVGRLENGAQTDKERRTERLKKAQADALVLNRTRDVAASKTATTRELSMDEWKSLSPSQQRSIELNDKLLAAFETDKTAMNTLASGTLRDQLGITDAQATEQEFAAGYTAIREDDLFGKGSMRAGSGVLIDGSDRDDSTLSALGMKTPTSTWQAGDNATARQRMIASISAGVEKYFQTPGAGLPATESGALDSILGKTSVTTGASQTDQLMAEIFDRAARKSVWESNTYDDLSAMLEQVEIPMDLFAQYAGERAADAEKTGQPLITDAGDALDVAAFRAALGLTEN